MDAANRIPRPLPAMDAEITSEVVAFCGGCGKTEGGLFLSPFSLRLTDREPNR